MSDLHDGGAELAAERGEQAHDLLGIGAVEIARRLVEQQYTRPKDERSRDRRALLFAARHRPRESVAAVIKTHVGDYLVQTLLHRTLSLAREINGHEDVLFGGEIGREIEKLKDESDGRAAHDGELAFLHGSDEPAVHSDFARGRAFDAAEDGEQGGLAAAARPEDGHENSRLDVEIYAAEHLVSAVVTVADAARFYECHNSPFMI